ncbi:MAG: hypothetical protein IPM54_11090 [Polyangiaceae bacterium]|nr:hypothetical protein [Polyangiaceae bacterium]
MPTSLIKHYIPFPLALAAVSVILAGCSEDPPPLTACDHADTGKATPVEIVIRSGATTPRHYATKCDSPFRVLSPTFGYAPANPSVLLCNTAPASCDSTCMDVGLMPLEPGGSKSFTWDGVVYVSVDAAQEGCPAANAGASCFSNCVRRQDGDAGEYKLTVRVYEEDLTLTEYETKFEYPTQTKVEVDIP